MLPTILVITLLIVKHLIKVTNFKVYFSPGNIKIVGSIEALSPSDFEIFKTFSG